MSNEDNNERLPLSEENCEDLVNKMSLSEALELIVRLGTNEEAIGEEYIRKAMQTHDGKLK